jgi:hypothetical protein
MLLKNQRRLTSMAIHFSMRGLCLGSFLVLALSACGGGDGGGSSPPPPSPSPPPAGTISYAAPPAYNVGAPIAALAPTVTGTVTSYTVTPALPAGLAINANNGTISGQPTAVSATTMYTVNASSSGTNISATVSLSVKEALPDFHYEKNSWQDVKGIASVPITPVVSAGTVTSWSISPALPAGLTLDTTTGVISGTPTIASAQQGYNVTASNPGGQSSQLLVIVVKDTPPNVSYAETLQVLPRNQPASIEPTNDTGQTFTWSVTPALPAGLSLNTSTGVISGTPTALSPKTAYQIVVSNPDDSTYLGLSISVEDGVVLLDLGHADSLEQIRRDGQRMVSYDANHHAVLWNAQTSAILATRDGIRPDGGYGGGHSVDVAGNTAVMQAANRLTLLDSATGAELAEVHTSGSSLRWWQLARDGSYVVAATADTLTAWSRAGAVLFTKTANYGGAKAFASAGELRIGGGPAAASKIELIAMPGGASTSSATHQGAFHSWFEDGEKFFTNTGTTIWVYSKEVAQLDFRAMSTINLLTGQGNWFWTHAPLPGLEVYAVGSSGAPAAAYPLPGSTNIIASGGTIGILPYGSNSVSIVDLSGGAPVKTDYSGPSHYFGAYAAANKDDWAVGAMLGVMLGEFTGTPQLYSRGQAMSIDGNANDIVVATASGHILDFNATTLALKRDIEYGASKVELSADGASVVAAPLNSTTQYSPVKNLRVYSLASGAVTHEWTCPNGGATLRDFDVADGADVIAQVSASGSGTPQRTVTTLAGGAIWASSSIAGTDSMLLSPDGTQAVVKVEVPPAGLGNADIYANGTLSGAVPGDVAGWLDNSRLVVNRYEYFKGYPEYNRTEVMDTTQTVSATFTASGISKIQPVTGNSFYSRGSNRIYDAATGATLFSSGDDYRDRGAVAGANVAYASGSVIWLRPR